MTARASAWADYVDARRQLIHQWHGDQVRPSDIAIRLALDVPLIEHILAQAPDPMPGSSRYQALALARRVEDLEQELHRVRSTAPPVPTPAESELRSLALHPHPARCGCQYWSGTPRPGDAHNPHCEHATDDR